MRQLIFVVLCNLLMVNSSFSQQTLLWEVRHQDGNKISYLLGTYHNAPADFVDSFPVIVQKLKESETAVFESQLGFEILKNHFNNLPHDKELEKILSQNEKNIIRTKTENKDLDFLKIPPVLLYGILKAVIEDRRTDTFKSHFDPAIFNNAMEGYLQGIAKSSGKQCIFFESIAQRLSLLEKEYKNLIVRTVVKSELHALIKRLDENKPDYAGQDKPIRVFEHPSLNQDYYFTRPCKGNKNKVYLEEPNKRWMEKILELVKDKGCFIAVGLEHLKSQCGLIMQLREKGYTVTPIPMITGQSL